MTSSCDVLSAQPRIHADDITHPSSSSNRGGSISSWKRRNDAVNVISAFMLTSVAICFTYPLASCAARRILSTRVISPLPHRTHDLSCFALWRHANRYKRRVNDCNNAFISA